MLTLWILTGLTFLVTFWAVVAALWKPWRRARNVKRLLMNANLREPELKTSVLVEPERTDGRGKFFVPPPEPLGIHDKRPGWSAGGTALLTAGTALAGGFLGLRFYPILGPSAPAITAVVLGALPFLYRNRKRRARFRAIEEQLPDALDFLARSVRAGNAFSISLELLTAEASEPLRSELLKITREQALGASLDNALLGFTSRVPMVEARFFVSAVLLQRETGGNLAEVLTKLSISIRERLRLRGQVKAAASQGRLTARVLTALPFVVVALVKVMSPEYLDGLINDPIGRDLLAAAVVSIILGYLTMKKITNIEV